MSNNLSLEELCYEQIANSINSAPPLIQEMVMNETSKRIRDKMIPDVKKEIREEICDYLPDILPEIMQDIVYSMTVRAFRNPVYTWLTDITENIDLDEFFHAILPYFVLARVYQRQEDAQLAAMYLGTFEEGVAIAKRDLMKASSAQPVIMSGGKQYPTMKRWLQTLGRTL